MPIRITKIKKENSDSTKCKRECGKLDHSHISDGNVKWYNHSGKQLAVFLKKLNMQLPYSPTVTLLIIYPREIKFMFPSKPVQEYLLQYYS